MEVNIYGFNPTTFKRRVLVRSPLPSISLPSCQLKTLIFPAFCNLPAATSVSYLGSSVPAMMPWCVPSEWLNFIKLFLRRSLWILFLLSLLDKYSPLQSQACSLCQNSISSIWVLAFSPLHPLELMAHSFLLSQVWSLLSSSQLTKPKSFNSLICSGPESTTTSESTAATKTNLNTPSYILHESESFLLS